MKFLFDALPIVLFFVAYKWGNLYIATFTAIAASSLQVLWTRWRLKRFDNMQLITLALVTLLGGATLWLRNELFIKWKPTGVYWILALAFWLSAVLSEKSLLQRMAGDNIQLAAHLWTRLNYAWILFFIAMGFTNLYVIYNYDTNTWVNFKLFGTLGLTAIFIIIQGLYISRYLPKSQHS
jgi:intracellular septation protein